jgi:hypothetical protein
MPKRLLLSLVILAVSVGAESGMEHKAQVVTPDADSLLSIINMLSVDPGTSLPRTRYTLREADLEEIADTLVSRLERYTGSTVTRQAFTVEKNLGDRDSTFTAENIICRVTSAGVSSGILMITAHYDATGSRTTGGWDWETEPAPGANDNATGVAAVLEAARLLSGMELPFDLEFVLFSAEELGRLGSIHYVDLCGAACADDMIGVINLDMIGFSGNGEGATLMSDFRSGWLADLIIAHAAFIDPVLPVTILKPGPWNWDHASFWERDEGKLTAVTLAEPLGENGSILYGYYHTTQDLIEHVDIDMTGRITAIMTDFIASFEDSPEEISILPSDILFLAGGSIRNEDIFDVGEEIVVWIRIRNTGGSIPPPGGSVELTVDLANTNGNRRIYSGDITLPEPLRSTDIEIPLLLKEEHGGTNRVTASISVRGMEDIETDNTSTASFVTTGASESIADHYFRPNPIDRDFEDAMFCINLSSDADLVVDIFSIDGESIMTARMGEGYGLPIQGGLNCYRCGDIFAGTNDLTSGIYIYRITVFNRSGGTEFLTGKFAVAN